MTSENIGQDQLKEHKRRIAFHEAGHATAIYFNNKARNLPPVFFQINLKNINGKPEEYLKTRQTMHDDCIVGVEGGRLVEFLPSSIDALADNTTSHDESMADLIKAIEADIINLLIGPLAEAKYVADTDGEIFNQKLVNLNALKHYGGRSDLALVNDYLQSFSPYKQQQDKKRDELFSIAFGFIKDQQSWAAITKLANYIIDGNKILIGYEEVVSLLGCPIDD
ncbi:hypothetical protein [Methylovulum psychrotolerans]|uniref:Peptidase M41 domain-containing protein n=1 Tax=Methylovulum psychrotolerans TaxID=1704499 RepID=A0A2S5CKN5_9GAMM|nr:hypothetical protein [Methylovulum psychrotolerans]POZ51302.1 hypothetical protein AADEFJLK_02750 [Methylovulum psychrotolerans]